jgi:hypothetical protein
MITLALSTLWVTVSTIAAAQQAAQGPMTLSGAVELALKNHPAVREARAGSAAASGEIVVARTAYLPRLDLLWQANRATRNNVFGSLLPQSVVPPVSGPMGRPGLLPGFYFRLRRLIDRETHRAVFTWILHVLATAASTNLRA